jgi:hypothetical protein
MTNSLFETSDKDSLPRIDDSKNYFEELVGEDKKFKTPEDLAKGKYQSDLYISQILERQDELRNDYMKLRDEYNSRAKLEELVDQLSQKQQLASNDSTDVKDKPPTFDPNRIDSLIDSKITERELNRRQTENFNKVKDKLIERFGERYQTVFKQQIDNLGLTEDYVNDLARRSPTAVFKTFGLDQEPQTQSFQSPFSSSVRADQFARKPQERTWSWYQDLKKKDPKVYWDKKTQNQMMLDHQSLGAKFQDGDFTVYGDSI